MKKKNLLVLSALILSLTGCANSQLSSSSINDSTTSNSEISSVDSSLNSSKISSSTISDSSSTSSSEEDLDIHVTSLEITNKETTKLKVGQELSLKVKILPSTATNKLVNYYSTDDKIASVDINGVITARKEGNVTIYAKSDDGEITDSISLNIISSTVTSFNCDFESNVEDIITNNVSYKKLIIGQSYKLNVTFNSTDESDNILEASFSIDGYCEFDKNTNTIVPLKKTSNLQLVIKVKGTSLKKTFLLKILTEGEQDVEVIKNKIDLSIEKENKLKINKYDVDVHFDTIDIYGNRTDAYQQTDFNIYKDSTSRYMIGDTETQVSYTENGSSTPRQAEESSHIFKGMNNDGNYYEFQVYNTGEHLVAPKKKAIVNEVSDSNTQISRDNAIKQSTKLEMDGRYGLSHIAQMHFIGLYENDIGYGSVPLYFGGLGAKNLKLTQDGNTFIADTYHIENRPTSTGNGEVYFNHGEYKFNDDGVLTSYEITSKVYDKNSFDFSNEKLNENPTYIKLYNLSYNQEFGELKTQDNNPLDPSILYFTDFKPVLAQANGYLATKYEIGKKYYISYTNPTPIYADSRIDSLIIDDSSNLNVATISDEGRSIKIEGAGITVLTVYSTKNNVMKQITVSVDTVLPNNIKVKVGATELKENELDLNINDSIDNLSFTIDPITAPQDVIVSSVGVGSLNKKDDGTYSFSSNVEGDATITIKSKSLETVSRTITIHVKKNDTNNENVFINTLIKNKFTSNNTSIKNTDDILKTEIEFISETKAKFKVIDQNKKTFIVNCNIVIDQGNKTITFNSFEVINEDYDAYVQSYFPVIKLNIPYQINENYSFNLTLLDCSENSDGVDFDTGESDNFTKFLYEIEEA